MTQARICLPPRPSFYFPFCGGTSYTVPTVRSKDWVDSMGTSDAFQNPLTIGANPILLESDLAPSQPTNLQSIVK